MPKKAKELKPVELSRLSPGRHHVGGVPGLLLQVSDPDKVLSDGRARTAKTWVLRYSLNGRRRDQGLGGFPEISLAEGRDRARAVRRKLFDGVDPLVEKAATKSLNAANARKSVTFKRATE